HAVRIAATESHARIAAETAGASSNSRPRLRALQIARTSACQGAVRADHREILRTQRLFRFGQSDLKRILLPACHGEDAPDEGHRRRVHRRGAGPELLL